MATTTVEFGAPAGLSLTLKLYPLGSNEAPAATAACSERAADPGRYYATLVDVPANSYHAAAALADGTVIARGYLRHENADAVEVVGEPVGYLSPAMIAELGGSGAWRVVITVTDGTDPVETARVRASCGGQTYVLTTDVDGKAVFALDDGTWSVRVTCPGFMPHVSDVVVAGSDTSLEVVLERLELTPSEPGMATGYVICYDEAGQVESGVEVEAKLVELRGFGVAGDAAVRQATSGENGLVEFPGLLAGGKYLLRRLPGGRWTAATIPSSPEPIIALPDLVG